MTMQLSHTIILGRESRKIVLAGIAQDTLSISVLEIDIVCSFNSRITSYRKPSAFLRVFFSRRVETLVFTTRAMRNPVL